MESSKPAAGRSTEYVKRGYLLPLTGVYRVAPCDAEARLCWSSDVGLENMDMCMWQWAAFKVLSGGPLQEGPCSTVYAGSIRAEKAGEKTTSVVQKRTSVLLLR